jgi:hypothetical protein
LGHRTYKLCRKESLVLILGQPPRRIDVAAEREGAIREL